MGSGCSTEVVLGCSSAPLDSNPDGQLKPRQHVFQRMLDKRRLRKAVEAGDPDRVLALLHRMPLHQINYVPVHKCLLDCQDPGRRGDCVLLTAAKLRHAGIVVSLLKHGALPDLTNEEGESALVVACINGDLNIVTALLEHKADPNIPSPEGSYPLHIAARNASPPIAQALLTHGANVNLRESGTMDTPLHITVLGPEDKSKMANAVSIAKSVINTGQVDFTLRNAVEDTALLKTVKKANMVLLKCVVDAGAPTNLFDAGGQAALHLAIALGASAGSAMAVYLANASQTDVNLISKKGLPPLLMAVRAVSLPVVKAILAREEANPNLTSVPGKAAPLHTALTQVPKELLSRESKSKPTPSEAIALAILGCGRADLNMQDGALQRPVFLAITCCSTLVLRNLIKQGVQLDVRDGDNHTPVLKAVLLGVNGEEHDAADSTLDAEARAGMVIAAAPNISAAGGPLGNTALHMVVSVGIGSLKLFGQLMSLKADVNQLNKAGSSPLHAAVCSLGTVTHAQDAAIAIAKCGRAKLDLRIATQDTALTLAAARHCTPVMSALVAAGADVNLANVSGDTAMHLACRSIGAGGDKRAWKPEPARALLASKALKLNLANGQGQTALAVLTSTARWWEAAVEVAGAVVAQSTSTLNNLDKAGLTALHYSLGAGPAWGAHSGLGHGPAIALLIIASPKSDVNILSTDKAAEAALHRVSTLALPKVCAALLKRSAKPNLANAAGMRPLHLAIAGTSEYHNRVAEQLIGCEDCDVNIIMPTTGQTPLLMAVVRCKADLAERLVKRKADPNIADKQGDTPLHAALRTTGADIKNERTAIVIIRCGRANLDAKSPAGDAPLHAAVAHRATESLRALVELKAELDVTDAGGCTPLHRASYAACVARDAGAEERAVILVKGGAKCDIPDPQACTAMHICVRQGLGSYTLFQALMRAKAGLNLLNKDKLTPLHIVMYRLSELKDAEAMALAISGCGRANLDLQAPDGFSALMMAADRTHLVIVKALVAAKADPNLRNSAQDTALTLAAARLSAPVMSELLAACADINAANKSGDTAMHLACRSINGGKLWMQQPALVLLGYSTGLKLNLANGQGQTALAVLTSTARWFEGAVEVADGMVAKSTTAINNLDKAGLTALHYSLGAGPAWGAHSGLGHGPAIALLIIAAPECDVNTLSKDKAAEAALHRVSTLGLPAVCAALLKRSADPNLPNAGAMRPLHLAIEGGEGDRTRVAEQLIAYRKTNLDLTTPAGQTPLLMVVLQCREQLMARLVGRSADPNIADKKGDTPLHAALRQMGTKATKEVALSMALALIAYARTNVDAKNPAGSAPVHLAVALASLPVAKALSARQADLSAVNAAGAAALHLAIIADGGSKELVYQQIALVLIDGGANPSQADAIGADTPLHLVARCGTGNVTIYRALAKKGANTNVHNKRGRTALHLAIRSAKKSGSIRQCDFDVIACGIVETSATNVNLPTKPSNKTPLLLCVSCVRPAVLPSLIRRRADGNIASAKGLLPLILALEMTEAGGARAPTSRAMAKDLIDSGLVNVDTVRPSDRSSPAHFATRLAATELLASLIARRARLDQQDVQGMAVMHLAARMACGRDAAEGLLVMQQLLGARASASLQDKTGYTPLHYAVSHNHGNLAAVRLLVDQRLVEVAADAKDKEGRTALMHAILNCASGSQDLSRRANDMALVIVKSGRAGPNVADPEGNTPLLLAVKRCKDATVLVALLAAGANAATRNKAQEAPLLLAGALRGTAKTGVRVAACGEMALALAASKSVEEFTPLVQLLLKRGANVNISNKLGSTPVHDSIRHAITTGSQAATGISTSLLRGGADVNRRDGQGYSSLHLTVGVGQGSLPLFETVMQRSPKLDEVTDFGATALHLLTVQAAEAGDRVPHHVTMCKALLAAGADVNLKAECHEQRTALHLSVTEGTAALFGLLLAHGPTRLDAVDAGGSSALHLALGIAGEDGLLRAHGMALAIITSRRADLKQADAQWRAPLSRAVSYGLASVVAALLEAGAPCNDVDKETGAVPLILAAQEYVCAGSSPGSSLCNRQGTLEHLIGHTRVDVNAVDQDGGDTALHLLIRERKARLAQKLLDRGPKLTLMNAARDTPLHLAMKMGSDDVSNLQLVERMAGSGAAQMSQQDADGNTAVHLAFDFVQHFDTVFAVCVRQCTNFDILNENGMAPVHLAVRDPTASERTLSALLRASGRCSAGLRANDGQNDTPLLMAIRQEAENAGALIRLLLGSNASVNDKDVDGYTGLTLALDHRLAEAVVMLLVGARGADLNARDPIRGNSAAAMALLNAQAVVLQALLRGGVDKGQRNNDGDALIHLTLSGTEMSDAERTRFLSILIEAQVDLNQPSGDDTMPIMMLLRPDAFDSPKLDLAVVMLDGGAKAVNDLDSTLGMGWIHAGCSDTRFINKWKSRGGDLSLQADGSQIMNSKDRLGTHGLNSPGGSVADAIFREVNSNVTAITLAALASSSRAVAAFLDLGVSPNQGRVCGPKAVTPFLVAVLQHDTAMASMLPERGAKVDGEEDGINPMSMAIQVAKGLSGDQCRVYAVDRVANLVAGKVMEFAREEAQQLLVDAVYDGGGDEAMGTAGEAAADVAMEVVGGVAGEVLGEVAAVLFDFVIPGISLVRWGIKLFRLGFEAESPEERRDEALRLSNHGCLTMVQWLLQQGCDISLADEGMAEMIQMIAFDDTGVGWTWAGLDLTWPSSFEPRRSKGIQKIERNFARMRKEREADELSTHDLDEEQRKAVCSFERSLRVTVTLVTMKKRARGGGRGGGSRGGRGWEGGSRGGGDWEEGRRSGRRRSSGGWEGGDWEEDRRSGGRRSGGRRRRRSSRHF